MSPAIKKSFVLCAIILLSIELALRFLLPAGFCGNFEYGYSDSQGYISNADNTTTTYASIARDFHAQTFTTKPTPGKLRVIALGDSVEYWSGAGVHVLSNTYPMRMTAELRTNGLDCETINLAVTGYGSLRNQVLLKHVLIFAPDVVLLKLNTVNEGTDESNLRHAEEFLTWKAMNWPRRTYFIQTLLILKENFLMRPLLNNDIIVQSLQKPSAKTASNAEPDASENARFVETVSQSIKLLRDKNIPVILVCQCFLNKDAEGHTHLSDHGLEKVANSLKQPGVEIFSLGETLKPFPTDKIFIDHVHMTPYGHEVAAKALAAKVRTISKPN